MRQKGDHAVNESKLSLGSTTPRHSIDPPQRHPELLRLLYPQHGHPLILNSRPASRRLALLLNNVHKLPALAV